MTYTPGEKKYKNKKEWSFLFIMANIHTMFPLQRQWKGYGLKSPSIFAVCLSLSQETFGTSLC